VFLGLVLSFNFHSPPTRRPRPRPPGCSTCRKKEFIDVNTATEAQLRAIPEIGDDYAKKIIAGRPYAKKEALMFKGCCRRPHTKKLRIGSGEKK